MLLEGFKALVTGSSRGIGYEIVKRFLAEGAEVWGLCTKPSKELDNTVAYAKENNTAYHEIYADCGNAEQLTQVINAAVAEAGSFDVLVNNAGITRDGLSFRMKMEDWQNVLNVNLTGAFVTTQIVSNAMLKAKKGGSIINMSSIVGVHGQGGQVNYSASKGGLIAYSKSLAKEVGSRGIRVNCIAPGFIETDMTAVLKDDLKKSMIDSVPLKRAGKPEDIANTAVFLASNMSTYITGQVIGVDGGMGC